MDLLLVPDFVLLTGAEMVGELVCSGVGTPLTTDGVKDAAWLKANRSTYNEALLAELSDDPHAAELWRYSIHVVQILDTCVTLSVHKAHKRGCCHGQNDRTSNS